MKTSKLPRLLAFDSDLGEGVEGLVAGVDEAGRGPLAGPVVASAVILLNSHAAAQCLADLNDSKQLRPHIREKLFKEIARYAVVGIGMVHEQQIDTLNIYQATRLAMKKAVLELTRTPNMVLVDGTMKLDLPIRQKAIKKGDQKSASIAAASVIAKVCRDAWMRHLDTFYPYYRFKKHKGYGTREHLEKIKQVGPCRFHRKTFAPVQAALSSEAKTIAKT